MNLAMNSSKKNILLIILLMLLFNKSDIIGQPNIDIYKYIEDPNVISENKEEPSVLLVPYRNQKDAVNYNIRNSEYYLSLNGTWKFEWKINPAQVNQEFSKSDFKDDKWNDINVPSVWQMQGYDHLMYRNIPMEFTPYEPPKVPRDINPTGCYRKEFDLPDSWEGRRTFIHFFGVQSAMFLWINGQYAGYHEDGMTSAEFDITRFLRPGKNIAAAMVLRWCDGSYLEDQDMFRYSGIYRDVFIYSKPEVMIRDLFIQTAFDENYKDADLKMDCLFKNLDDEGNFSLRYTLYDKDGSVVISKKSESFKVGSLTQKTFTQKIDSPLKWSDEKPNLYTLTLELLDSKENIIEIVSQRIGFRELEVKDGIALLNGKPVYFRGTNRHEHNPDNGKTLTKELMLKDIQLLKQFNFNSVRTSHYPNDPLWYDLCDEYGILLQDEVNAECHYTEDAFPQRKDYFNSFIDRFKRMVQRDKNHPSVVMWSTGNECGLAEPHYAMADYVKKADPTRFLMHQSNWPNGEAPYVDIIGPRYPTPPELHQIGLKAVKPVVMGEYAHAMGSSLGHFDEFWDIIYSTPKLHGGFVWDWIDQGLNVKSRFTIDSSPNNIQCGVMGSPEIVKGQSGNAFRLSGLDDWIEVYDDKRLDIKGDKLVIEAVVSLQNFYTENPIITKAYQFGIIQATPDSISFYINSYKNILTAALPDSWNTGWHKIKAIYDGSKMQIFLDDKLVSEKSYKDFIRSTHYPVNIGRDAFKNNEQWPGWISNYIFDEVKIYDSVDDITKQPLLWLKFDEIQNGENYFTFGISPFCHNGMITADRKPQPELWQAKHSMSPIRFFSDDPGSGKFVVNNKYAFTNMDEFDIEWYVYSEGKNLNSGKVEISAEAHSQKQFSIPLPADLDRNQEYIIELSCKLKKAEPFMEKGFEVYFQQFRVSSGDSKRASKIIKNSENKITFNETESYFSLKSNGSRIELNKKTGDFDFYSNDKQVVSSMNANIWRAPISNERVNWGRAEAEEWFRMGLNELFNAAEDVKIIFSEDSSAAIVKVRSLTQFPYSSDYIINHFEYKLTGGGAVEIKHDMVPLGRFHMDWLPCIGLTLKIKDEFKSVTWFGHGPYENYVDRNTGTRISTHSVNIDSVQNPYAEPQDYGNYSDVNWFEIRNKAGEGLRISANKEINFSAVPFYNLDRARYTFQLKKDDYSRININYGATGVGDTPNPVMPPYRVYPQKYSNEILLEPIKNRIQSVK